MAEELTNLRSQTDLFSQRPELVQEIKYTLEPKYYKHQYYEDKLAIMVCQIKIWQAEGNQWFNIPSANKCLTLRECESIEITDSSKELINKAVVRFPRGTVISLSSKKEKTVYSGNKDMYTEFLGSLKETGKDGDVTSKESSQYSEDGVSTTSMAANYDNKGLIDFNRSKKETALLSPNDVAIGNRIEIRLGYAYSESEFKRMNTADSDPNMTIAFTGFITSISPNTPLELECTNMAHVLSCVSTPEIPAKGAIAIKEFLDDDGQFHLLQDTGIPLAEWCKGSETTVSGGSISENLTVADVLTAWGQKGVRSLINTKKNGSVELCVGLTYYAGKGGVDLPNSDKKYITYNNGENYVKLIQFDWDVAEDKLTLKKNDKKYFAVEAQGWSSANQCFKVTVRKNPDNDDEGWMIDADDDNFQTVNQRKLKETKKSKWVNGTWTNKRLEGHMTDKVNLSKYTIAPYISPKIDITQDELIEEAKQYWAKCVPNGISGSIVIFGDLEIKPTDIIGLIDIRQPEKNGYYFVESVHTTFSVNQGYRRELKIPFKIASFSKTVQLIK